MSNLIKKNENIKIRNDNLALITQPILNIPSMYKILFDDRLINIAAAYYDCLPAIGSLAVRKSFLNDVAPMSNQFFHRDYNSTVKLLKFAIYLNDVDIDGGPFTYVQGSNNKMPKEWYRNHYWPDKTIKNLYGQENIRYLTANFGDLMIANTKGFHKGQKPVKSSRVAMHFTYLIHPELDGQCKEIPLERGFQIRKEDFEDLPDWKKPVADFLLKV